MDTDDRAQQVLDLAKKIVRAELALADMRSRFDALVNGSDPTPLEQAATPAHVRGVRAPGLLSRIQTVLDSAPGETWTPAGLARLLGAPLPGVRTSLSKLLSQGFIERLGLATYRARQEPAQAKKK